MPRRKSYKRGKRQTLNPQARRHLQNVVLGLVVVVSTLVLFLLLSLWQALHLATANASESLVLDREFDPHNRFNVLLLLLDDRQADVPQIKSLNLLSVNPVDNTAAMISVPSDMSLAGVTDLGDVKVSGLYGLGKFQSQKKDEDSTSVQFTASVLEDLLALKIEKYVLIDNAGLKSLGEEMNEEMKWDNFNEIFSLGRLPGFYGAMRSFSRVSQTDLKSGDALSLLRFLLSIRSDKIQKLEVPASLLKDPFQLDAKLQNFARDEVLYEERLSVQILNGTIGGGLAQKASRFVENLGGWVVGVGNTAEGGIEKSYILARDPDAYTVRRLMTLFGIKEVREYSEVYGIKDRADVSVVIGLDLVKKF